jgi:hypothetical protein
MLFHRNHFADHDAIEFWCSGLDRFDFDARERQRIRERSRIERRVDERSEPLF